MLPHLAPIEISQFLKPGDLLPKQPDGEASTILAADSDKCVVVISGPPAVGKTTVLAALESSTKYPTTYARRFTTRTRRIGESDSEYDFVPDFGLDRLRSDEIFYAERYPLNGEIYGLRRSEVRVALSGTRRFVGAVGTPYLAALLPRATFIYLIPPSIRELERRARTSHRSDISDLTAFAINEMKAVREFFAWARVSNFRAELVVNEANEIEGTCDAVCAACGSVKGTRHSRISLLDDLIL